MVNGIAIGVMTGDIMAYMMLPYQLPGFGSANGSGKGGWSMPICVL